MVHKRKLPLSNTRLAQWLALKMGHWKDPETGMYGMSGAELGRKAGCTRSHISLILKHGRIPGYQMLNRIAEVFNTHPVTMYRIAYLPEKYWEEE